MVDRQNLTDKAKSVGKSVAGTLGEKAQQLKSKAKTLAKDPETGIEISEVNGQYLVIDGDGNATGPFENRRNAAAKAREMKREMEEESQGGGKAAKFSQKVNETAGKAKDKLQSAGESIDTDDSGGSGMSLGGMGGGMGENGGPSLPAMDADDSDESEPSMSFLGDPDGDGDPEFAFATDFDGDGDQEQGIFETNADADSGPSLPDFGGGGGEGPSLPGFGPPADDDDGGPMLPGFGMQESDDEDDEQQFPWM